MLRRVCRLYGESADNYEELADGSIPTGASVLETAESELESTDSSADSSADSAKVSVWVQASISPPYLAICVKIKDEIPTRCCNLFGFDVSIEHFIRNNQYEINMPDKKPTLVYIQSKPYSTSLSWGSHWDSLGLTLSPQRLVLGLQNGGGSARVFGYKHVSISNAKC